jgi:hypothetical protein
VVVLVGVVALRLLFVGGERSGAVVNIEMGLGL